VFRSLHANACYLTCNGRLTRLTQYFTN
jgi:hypothetical protein